MSPLQLPDPQHAAMSTPPPPPQAPAAPALTDEETAHFLAHGWIKLANCFTQEQADWVVADVWTRLGFDPNDKSTWTSLRTNMPHHRIFDVAALAPRAWAAICALCGGEDRIDPASREWRDSLIVNLGSLEHAEKPQHPHDLQGWHVDGDFFVHYLDSREQGLLVIPLFTDILPDAGGTMICPEAIPKVAKWLYEHPDGVSPGMVPRGEEGYLPVKNLGWFNNTAKSCENFVEATGQVGDVYLLHPLMLHSASHNARRNLRIITNPPIFLKDEMCFDREDGDYSLVERHTLKVLGRENLKGWKATGPREPVVPERIRIQEEMKKAELQRLEEARKVSVAA